MKKYFNEELFKFINTATCAFTCIDAIKKELIEKIMFNFMKTKNGILKRENIL